MNRSNVVWVLRTDGLSNLFAGLVLLTFYRPVVALIGWPDTQMPIYANVLGAALIGAVVDRDTHLPLSRTVARHHPVKRPYQGACWSDDPLLGVRGRDRSTFPLAPAAVGAQVLFVLGEAAYCLPSRTRRSNRWVAW
jgi:hypothetical protein